MTPVYAQPAASPPTQLAANPLDAQSLLATFGTLGIALILFAETGLLIGFFLPGDSPIFTAGLLSAGARLSLPWVLLAAGALAGAQTGYLLGRDAGPAILTRTRSRKISEVAARAAALLGRYGYAKALVRVRFHRTVLNPLAGILNVPARAFALWQILRGLLWSAGLVRDGFDLGASVPHVDQYLLPIIGVIVVVCPIPVAVDMRRTHCSDGGIGCTSS